MVQQSPRAAALRVLRRVEQEAAYSNLALAGELSRGGLDAQGRAFASALLRVTLERVVSIDWLLARFCKTPLPRLEPEVRAALRLGAAQLLYMNGVTPYAAVNETVALLKNRGTRGLVNGTLRSIERAKDSLPRPDAQKEPDLYLSVTYSCPLWLVRKWRAEYGQEALVSLLEAINAETGYTLRANTLKTSPAALCALLGGGAQPLDSVPGAVKYASLPPLEGFAPFEEGLFHVQGAASQLCCLAVGARPGETVLDLCAAPGGKSFTITQQMGDSGRLLACELHEKRIDLIRRGAKRLGITCIECRRNDACAQNDARGLFDRVLCDVPCSGLGVLRRKPELRLRSPDDFASLPALQYTILQEGAHHVRPGGVLVYSTCTLSRAENDDMAARFLAEHPDFSPGPLPPALRAEGHSVTLLPSTHGTDGFFLARFQRK